MNNNMNDRYIIIQDGLWMDLINDQVYENV